MPRNSNGVYSLPAGNPVISGTVIESEWANSTMEDIAEALTWSLDRRGFGGMTVPLYFADGTEALPGAAWDNEQSTGFYRAALGDVRVSVLGQDLFRWWNGEAYVWDEANNIWQRVVASNSIDVDSSGNVTFNNNVNVEGELTVDGTLVLTGDTTIDGTLVVEGENINMIIAGSGALNRPYRYWKVDEIESSSLYLALSEIRLALNGVDNLQVGTTFTVDGMVGTPLSGTGRLNDGETDLDYVINGTPDGDFSALSFNWDFTNPKALSDISQFPADVFTPGYMTAFTVSASDDGVTWTKLARFSDLTATLGEYSSRNYMFNAPGIPEAPIDGQQYARQDAAWAVVTGGGGGGGAGVLTANVDEFGFTYYSATIGAAGDFPSIVAALAYLGENPTCDETVQEVRFVCDATAVGGLAGGNLVGWGNGLPYQVKFIGPGAGSLTIDLTAASEVQFLGNLWFQNMTVLITAAWLSDRATLTFRFCTVDIGYLYSEPLSRMWVHQSTLQNSFIDLYGTDLKLTGTNTLNATDFWLTRKSTMFSEFLTLISAKVTLEEGSLAHFESFDVTTPNGGDDLLAFNGGRASVDATSGAGVFNPVVNTVQTGSAGSVIYLSV